MRGQVKIPRPKQGRNPKWRVETIRPNLSDVSRNHPLLDLQQTIGNQAVGRLLQSGDLRADPKTDKPIIVQTNIIRRQQAPAPKGKRLDASWASGILNSEPPAATNYAKAVTILPNSNPIWPHLKSRQARENFLRYIVKFDLTQCRPYKSPRPHKSSTCRGFARAKETFVDKCQGYASQMYLRYSLVRKGLTPKVIGRLGSIGRIYADNTAPKFRMPIFMVSVPGHAFNAVLVGSNKKDISSYLFLEPQTDLLFRSNSSNFQRHFGTGIITFSTLVGYGKRGQYRQKGVATFVKGSSGKILHQQLTAPQRVYLKAIFADFFIADRWNSWKTSVMAKPWKSMKTKIKGRPELTTVVHKGLIKTDPGYTKKVSSLYKAFLSNRSQKFESKHLALAGQLLIGRKFRRYPLGSTETLTRATYLNLINKPSVGPLLKQKRR